MRLLRAPGRVSSRLAMTGLGLVLIFLASFTVWTAVHGHHQADAFAHDSSQYETWQSARVDLAAEETLLHKYIAKPAPTLRAQFTAAAASVDRTLAALERGVENQGTAAEVAHARAAHAQLLRAAPELFAAVDQQDAGRIRVLQLQRIDPAFDAATAAIAASTARDREEVAEGLEELHETQDEAVHGTLAAFGVGMVLLAGFWMLVVSYQHRVERQALHDALTGLPNRTLLLDRTEQAVGLAGRHGLTTGLLLIDLDRFKDVNDTLGHRYGDELLQQVGERLGSTVRDSDTIARLGGDEFAVLLPQIPSVQDAIVVADKLRAAIEEPFTVRGLTLDIDASVGVAAYPEHGNDAQELLQRADVAMYAAKATHAGYVVYDPSLDRHSPRRLTLLGQLRRALTSGELVLHYQPKAELGTGRILGVEALVRWQHPEHGLLGPDEFIPLAESTGLIRPLTSHVLAVALRQCRQWLDAGQRLSVAVNLSARCLLDLSLPAEVAQLLATWQVPAGQLMLEITESAFMTDPDRALEVLARLHGLGAQLSIDDFGTGYSSMAYLKSLPVQELKVDRSFVMQMLSNPSDAVIVRSTVDLGHNLGLRVVAEGVEDEPTLQELAALGCDIAQGYHLARPMPAADLAAWLADRPQPVAARD